MTGMPRATPELERLASRPKLDAVLAALSDCAGRIQALIPEIQAELDRRSAVTAPDSQKPPRIIFGGGSSALVGGERELQSQSTQTRRRSASDLFVVAELALAGHSRDEIAAYLRARRGPAAGRVIAEAFERRTD